MSAQAVADSSQATKQEEERFWIIVFNAGSTGLVERLNQELGQHAEFVNGHMLHTRAIQGAFEYYGDKAIPFVIIRTDPHRFNEWESVIDGAAKRPLPKVKSFDFEEIIKEVRETLGI